MYKLKFVIAVAMLLSLTIPVQAIDTELNNQLNSPPEALVISDESIVEDSSSGGSGKIFYAVDCHDYPSNSNFVWFDPDNPSIYNNITLAGWPNNTLPLGGTFIHEDWWICDNEGNIWIVDIMSGEVELFGNTGVEGLVSLSYHYMSKKLYAMSPQALYIIDMDTCNATLIGSFHQPDHFMVSMSCADPLVYVYDLNYKQSLIYTVDTGSGTAHPVGLTGVNTIYNQDIAYDWNEEKMYACVFNYDTFQGELHGVNLETGKFTYIDTLYNGHHTICLGIPLHCICNNPPAVPIIQGEKEGKIGIEYEYNILLSEPDDDSMYLRIDWGDGTQEHWQGPYLYNATVRYNHTWIEKGTYNIRVQSMDVFGLESEWGELRVTMPHTFWWLDGLLDRFPLLQRLLEGLIK